MSAGAIALFAMFFLFGKVLFSFFGKMALFATGICVMPTIAHYLGKKNIIVSILLEVILLTLLLYVFIIWLLRMANPGIWLLWSAVMLVVIEIGGYIIKWHFNATKNRISKMPLFSQFQGNVSMFQTMLRNGIIFYLSIPIGFMAGTIAGLIMGLPPQRILILSVIIVLILAQAVLLGLLIASFARMIDPIFKASAMQGTGFSNECLTEKKGMFNRFTKILRLVVPQLNPFSKSHQEDDLSFALIATDIRKLYLYDAIHNAVLLVAYTAACATLFGFSISVKWIIVAAITASLFFNQLPYVIGQSLLHQKVLERYEGMERATMTGDLKKHVPLLPIIDFMTALFASGTGGGFLYIILNSLISNAFK